MRTDYGGRAGKVQHLVGSHGLWIAAKQHYPLQHAHNVHAMDAVINHIHAFVAEVVGQSRNPNHSMTVVLRSGRSFGFLVAAFFSSQPSVRPFPGTLRGSIDFPASQATYFIHHQKTT